MHFFCIVLRNDFTITYYVEIFWHKIPTLYSVNLLRYLSNATLRNLWIHILWRCLRHNFRFHILLRVLRHGLLIPFSVRTFEKMLKFLITSFCFWIVNVLWLKVLISCSVRRFVKHFALISCFLDRFVKAFPNQVFCQW